MGAKSRLLMEQAKASLEARKAAVLGPAAPPCANAKCNPGGQPSRSTGTVRIGAWPGKDVPVCSPLRCAFDVAGDLSAMASYAPHRPGQYREV